MLSPMEKNLGISVTVSHIPVVTCYLEISQGTVPYEKTRMLARGKSTRFSLGRSYLRPRVGPQAKRQRAECVIVSSMTPPSPHLTKTNRFTAENSEKMKKKAKRCDFRLTEKGWIISLGSMRICLYLLPVTLHRKTAAVVITN